MSAAKRAGRWGPTGAGGAEEPEEDHSVRAAKRNRAERKRWWAGRGQGRPSGRRPPDQHSKGAEGSAPAAGRCPDSTAINDGVSIQLLLFSQLPNSHLPTWWRKGKEGEGLGGIKRNTEARISFPKEWRANISGKKQAWHTVLRASHKFRTVSVR